MMEWSLGTRLHTLVAGDTLRVYRTRRGRRKVVGEGDSSGGDL